MMLETLFTHQQQERAFLVLTACGVALGLLLHLGGLLRRFGVLRAIWDALTAAAAGGMVFAVALRFHSGLQAYAALGLLLGLLLYMAGLSPILQGMTAFFRKVSKKDGPKAGKAPADDESTVQRQASEVNGG